MSEIPVISQPPRLIQRMVKVKAARDANRVKFLKQHNLSPSSTPIIVTKDVRMNHYAGQRYPRDEVPLISKSWETGKSNGKSFVVKPMGPNPSFSRLENQFSFSRFDLPDTIIARLESAGYLRPTEIQRLAYPVIARGRNALVAAEAGSGKTLAFGLPLLKRLAVDPQGDPPNVPALILSPERELCLQIFAMLAPFAADFNVPISCHVKDMPEPSTPDLTPSCVVGTPGTLLNLVKSDTLSLRHLRHLVIDEADSLLDDSFSNTVFDLLSTVKVQRHVPDSNDIELEGCQLILSAATIPSDIDIVLAGFCDETNIDFVSTRALHRMQPNLTQTFERLSFMNKPERLLQIVKQILEHRDKISKEIIKTAGGQSSDFSASVERTAEKLRTFGAILVFVNRVDTCDKLTELLASSGLSVAKYHGRLPTVERELAHAMADSGEVDVLVTTDVASRGLDWKNVSQVVNFDFPHFAADYIHRVGRVGRVGQRQRGHIYNLVSNHNQAFCVQLIEKAIRTDSEIPYVDANIKRLIRGRMENDGT